MPMLRSIWNGPFFVGKLTQPVTVGDVMLKILEVLWRGLMALVGLMLGTAAVVAAYVYVIEPEFFPPAKDSVKVTAIYAADFDDPPPAIRTVTGGQALPSMAEVENRKCARDFPIRISIYNNGSKPITGVRYSLEGYQPDYSSNYVLGSDYVNSERIIPPGEGFSVCQRVRTKNQINPNQLTYKVDVWSASFASE